ncbi:Rid family detoxifying hydrolase [Paenibacillus filicis]|uniref:Rid family detoxifying hydrolase n=1 Tax=Paenibacillus gyeongsangnamensis TaxID=3388067 RepID=A0ABT4Q3R0_9BACL|nr:Rid family detoxifying hydrolase [Paenibacillus filicis]MCZ8511446.1 Rid family detoxifying hydrolase [Paenibacillus filicis]
MKKEIQTSLAPGPVGPYSQGIQVGNRVYVAGQGPLNPETGTVPETIEEQTRQVLKNIQNILTAAGATMDHVVKVTAHLSDLKYFDAYNSVYQQFFSKPYPVRTTVGSQLENILVEIDVIAEI